MAWAPAAAKPAGLNQEERTMDLGGLNWSIMTIVGPLLLAGVILWALLRNRRATRSDIDRTERATREPYKEEDAIHRGEGDERGP